MKLNRLETHDRLEHFIADQSRTIWQGFDDCLKKNPLSLSLQEKSPYIYIFAHPRTSDDGLIKRMLWQPRLSKPRAQTNSYLFRGVSKTDVFEICWMIPPREVWKQYEKGNLTEEPTVVWSIHQFVNNRKTMEAPERDDLSDEKIKSIYATISRENKKESLMDKLYLS